MTSDEHPLMILFEDDECHVLKVAVAHHKAMVISEFEHEHSREFMEMVLGVFDLGTRLGFIPKEKGGKILEILLVVASAEFASLTEGDALLCGCNGKMHRGVLEGVMHKLRTSPLMRKQ
jgi:hypothetical protein